MLLRLLIFLLSFFAISINAVKELFEAAVKIDSDLAN